MLEDLKKLVKKSEESVKRLDRLTSEFEFYCETYEKNIKELEDKNKTLEEEIAKLKLELNLV